jgi:hypothetical protein
VQVMPFPVKPLWQVQLYEPGFKFSLKLHEEDIKPCVLVQLA